MAAVIGATSKARASSTGEESQDIDWDNLPAPPPSKSQRQVEPAKGVTAPTPHPRSDFWGGSQLPDEENASQLATLDDKQESFDIECQDDGRTIGASQEYGRPKNEANSDAGKGGTGKKPGRR